VLGGARYLIDGVFMPGQSVHGSTSELTEDGLGEYFTDLAVSNYEACERMFFWGHVHPGNSTSPSGQDEDQMKFFDHNDWFIRGIFGRSGRCEFTFFDYKNGVRWNDAPWAIYCPVSEERRSRWAAEVAAKVEQIVQTPAHFQGGTGGYHPFQRSLSRRTTSTSTGVGKPGKGKKIKKQKSVTIAGV
jgi:hypothetical protein